MSARLPLLLDLRGCTAVVVGAGAVAARRMPALLEAGARVVVVAPESRAELPPGVELRRRAFDEGDLDGADLVLACTDAPEVNARVHELARARHVWCVRADDAATSSAWWPAQGRVGDVTVAVSSADPARSAGLRDALLDAVRTGSARARRRRGRAGVVLVGAGPGDPDLVTLRGWRELLDADVVVHDRLGSGQLLEALPDEVERLDVGKSPGGRGTPQEAINAVLVERAGAGQRVVRLKGGDPYVLGRGAEEVAACRAAGVPVEVVPGLTSALAAPALAGVPVTHRGVSQHVVVASGHAAPGGSGGVDWRALGSSGATLVLLMAVENRAAIAGELLAGGRSPETPVVAVVDASLATQERHATTLGGLAGLPLRPPAVIVVGEVAGLAR